MQLLRGKTFRPPDRHRLSSDLLPELHTQLLKQYHESIKDCVGTLSVDGWSDAKSDSLLGLGLNVHGKGYLLDLVDTKESHTSDNVFPVLLEQMKVMRTEAGCCVGTVVSDNAANMDNTRRLVVAAQLKEVDSLHAVVQTVEAGTPRHTVWSLWSPRPPMCFSLSPGGNVVVARGPGQSGGGRLWLFSASVESGRRGHC